MKELLRKFAQQVFPVYTRRQLVRFTCWPPVGLVPFISLRRLKPISLSWGEERGQPIDRYYIARFLETHAGDIQGHVLEIGTDLYTQHYGRERVTKSDVLHVAERRPQVTIIGDLGAADHIPSDTYDCVILTQTLQFIFDVSAVIRTVYRILKPGGVVLVTVPGISQISRYDMDRWGHYWSFTTRSIQNLFEMMFPVDQIQIESYGNVAVSMAFLCGLASQDLRRKLLNYDDPDYQLLISVRAVKPK
jgi:SAM-dependent methyltransferase